MYLLLVIQFHCYKIRPQLKTTQVNGSVVNPDAFFLLRIHTQILLFSWFGSYMNFF
jgi:hypothetical protein